MVKEDLVEQVTLKVSFEWAEGAAFWKKSSQAKNGLQKGPEVEMICVMLKEGEGRGAHGEGRTGRRCGQKGMWGPNHVAPF